MAHVDNAYAAQLHVIAYQLRRGGKQGVAVDALYLHGVVRDEAVAYGGEMKDAVESVVCYYLPEQRLYEVMAEKCGFEYRSSFFKKIPGNVILSAVFRLAPGDKAGLKGFSVGGAQVSEKHAGFVVNTGSATAADVHELLKQVRKRVYDHSQVLLEPEIILYPPDYKLEDRGPQVPRNKFVDTGVIAMPEDEAQEDK